MMMSAPPCKSTPPPSTRGDIVLYFRKICISLIKDIYLVHSEQLQCWGISVHQHYKGVICAYLYQAHNHTFKAVRKRNQSSMCVCKCVNFCLSAWVLCAGLSSASLRMFVYVPNPSVMFSASCAQDAAGSCARLQ